MEIGYVLDKVLNDIYKHQAKRDNQVLSAAPTKSKANWTDVEVAQLLVAVHNLGEGEWFEI